MGDGERQRDGNIHVDGFTQDHLHDIGAAVTHDGNLIVSVEDDGPGIAEDEREKALNWGKRLDEAAPGTGFGLSIVTDIADLYEGQLQLGDSEIGGLKVDIIIPGAQKDD